MNVSEADIAKEFNHVGFTCLVIAAPVDNAYNGYIKLADSRKELYDVDYESLNPEVEREELTFSGEINDRGFFVGFDTLHVNDTPETQTVDAVTERTKRLAEELQRVDVWRLLFYPHGTSLLKAKREIDNAICKLKEKQERDE